MSRSVSRGSYVPALSVTAVAGLAVFAGLITGLVMVSASVVAAAFVSAWAGSRYRQAEMLPYVEEVDRQLEDAEADLGRVACGIETLIEKWEPQDVHPPLMRGLREVLSTTVGAPGGDELALRRRLTGRRPSRVTRIVTDALAYEADQRMLLGGDCDGD